VRYIYDAQTGVTYSFPSLEDVVAVYTLSLEDRRHSLIAFMAHVSSQPINKSMDQAFCGFVALLEMAIVVGFPGDQNHA
jgi:hypothetical protein